MFQRGQQNPYSTYGPDVIDVNQVDQESVNAYIVKVFGWMFAGLLITAVTTMGIVYGISTSYAFAQMMDSLLNMFLVIFIAKVLAIGWLSARVTQMNPVTAKLIYITYAVVNGLTFGLVAVLFAAQVGGIYTLGMAFGITAASFGIMAVYGLTTRKDLTAFSSLFRMGLIGLIIASVANMFLGNSMMDFIICVVGLFIFLGLTARDTNMIKHQFAQVALKEGSNSPVASNLAIMGALMLYLNFINMFMFILRLLGRNR